MIFTNPAGAPELACDACGCRWFDRMSGACYECGAPVSAEAQAQYRDAIVAFRGALANPQVNRASSEVPAEVEANERRPRWPS